MTKYVKQFIEWYNRDTRTMLPIPSNKMGFWSVVFIIVLGAIKLLTEYYHIQPITIESI